MVEHVRVLGWIVWTWRVMMREALRLLGFLLEEHVRVLGCIGIARAALGLALGIVLVLKAHGLDAGDYFPAKVAQETVDFDRAAFWIAGSLCLILAPVRAAQAAGALAWRPWARAAGLGLAAFDLLNLALFPLSTVLGLYALVVYRHADTVARFRERGRGAPCPSGARGGKIEGTGMSAGSRARTS